MDGYFKYILALFALSFALQSCVGAPPVPNLPAAPKEVSASSSIMPKLEPYRLQVGDVMDIKIMLNPELNEQSVTVRPDGMISTTVAHEVQAYGMTTSELQHELERRYSEQLVHPQIAVIVHSFTPNRVYVLGEVNAPGEFTSTSQNLTLMQAIARAGGVKNSAGAKNIVILRRTHSQKPAAYAANYTAAATGADPASDVPLAPYDVVYVPRSDVADTYLNYQQYIQEFLPPSFGVNYQLNPQRTQ